MAERPSPEPKRTPADIEAEITQTREELADTVDALGERLQRTKQQSVKVATGAGATLAAIVVIVVVIRTVRARR